MTSERWRQVEAVFDAASQVREDERAAYLDRICRADVELRAEVESLLAADGRAGAFLASGIQRQAESLSRQVSATVIGRRIGPYRITSVLGRGGIGSVYQALREDDVY
ncbi:MAG: hypothetical protein IT165_33910 [Bryobacterales bacterium]|nr:hypothetical protein [Bryobacterales bacterium]